MKLSFIRDIEIKGLCAVRRYSEAAYNVILHFGVKSILPYKYPTVSKVIKLPKIQEVCTNLSTSLNPLRLV